MRHRLSSSKPRARHLMRTQSVDDSDVAKHDNERCPFFPMVLILQESCCSSRAQTQFIHPGCSISISVVITVALETTYIFTRKSQKQRREVSRRSWMQCVEAMMCWFIVVGREEAVLGHWHVPVWGNLRGKCEMYVTIVPVSLRKIGRSRCC